MAGGLPIRERAPVPARGVCVSGGALLKPGIPRWGRRVGTRSDGLGALLSSEPET